MTSFRVLLATSAVGALLGAALAAPAQAGSIEWTTPCVTYYWSVPAGVSSITVEAWGAWGGAGGGSGGFTYGGEGGSATQSVSVVPGRSFQIVVGAAGLSFTQGGAGGCGVTSGGNGVDGGGGGGGGTTVLADGYPFPSGGYQLFVVAGGGGGAGGDAIGDPPGGGNGGGSSGSPGGDGFGAYRGYGGAGGTQSAGGARGLPNGTAGSYSGGGAGGNGCYSGFGGGGGGGGYYGGGGGGGGSYGPFPQGGCGEVYSTGGGGGGGSGYTVAGGPMQNGGAVGNGAVKISWQDPPTAATFPSLQATDSPRGILLRWRTGTEANTLGFHVYRQAHGKRTRINRALIPAKGAPFGAAYSYLDPGAGQRRGLRYWIEEVGTDGTRMWRGPARIIRRR